MPKPKKILLIDLDDDRRESRVRLLQHAGYEVDLRKNSIEADRLDHEGHFDLVVLALHKQPQLALEYIERLGCAKPTLPVLLLTDLGVFAPKGSLSSTMESGHPAQLMKELAKLLEGSSHVREIGE